MGEKLDKKHAKEELKEMIRENRKKEPVDKIMALFCHRHGVSMNTCKKYYDQMVANGEIEDEK